MSNLSKKSLDKQVILAKADDLVAKFTDPADPADLERFKSLRDRIGDLLLVDGVKDHEGIKILIDFAVDELKMINKRLQTENSTVLADKHRDRLFDRKNLWRWFLDFFMADKELEAIEEAIDEELRNYEENYK